MNVIEQRQQLLQLGTQVAVKQTSIEITIQPAGADQTITINVRAELVSKGSDLKLAIAPDDRTSTRDPDPVLLRLIAHAFAAQDQMVGGSPSPLLADYSKRHLQQLCRLSCLAPDIISAIVDGSQPAGLTGRKLLRIGNLPLDWAGQRVALGFE